MKLLSYLLDFLQRPLTALVTVSRIFVAGIMAIVAVLVLPWRRVRIGILPVDEIGPLTRNPHHYLWMRSKEVPSRTWDIWVFKPGTFVCNAFVVEKWSSEIRVTSSWLTWWAGQILLHIGGEKFSIPLEKSWSKLPSRQFDFRLGLNRSEESTFDESLTQLGITDLNRVVTLCVRDPAYKAAYRNEVLPVDLKESYRNHPISDFENVARELVGHGFTVVRMGAAVSEPFLPGVRGVVDYASTDRRTELIDIGLMSRSLLCISTSLGIDQVAAMAGKSRCVVNYLSYHSVFDFYPWDHVTVQRILNVNDGRELTLIEALGNASIANFRGSEDLLREGLVTIRNSPEEIRHVALEALQYRLQPRALSGENLRRQKRFWEILERHAGIEPLPLERRPRIGSEFLQNYEWWLE